MPDINPHPEEPAKRASRRMQATDGASWFETRFALLTMRVLQRSKHNQNGCTDSVPNTTAAITAKAL